MGKNTQVPESKPKERSRGMSTSEVRNRSAEISTDAETSPKGNARLKSKDLLDDLNLYDIDSDNSKTSTHRQTDKEVYGNN